jgi:Holliday junction resolvase
MSVMSKRKGARGERELAAYLSDHGHPARRGQQYSGSPDSPDVICESLPALHFETKRTERLRLHESIKQAIADAGQGKVPVVAHKANRRPWLAILRLDDLLTLLEVRP